MTKHIPIAEARRRRRERFWRWVERLEFALIGAVLALALISLSSIAAVFIVKVAMEVVR